MNRPIKVALTGDVALEILAPYFREAGYDTYVPSGFGTWRQELLDADGPFQTFAPDYVCPVTSYDSVLSAEVPNFYDERMRLLASQPYSLDGIRAIVEEFTFSTMSAPKKILAVDADNTLWKGILSEDGEAALEPFVAFQKGLLALRASGVLLVLLTKNDPFVLRSDMPLSNASFAAVRMNWAPKPGNLLDVCRELNLSADSVVFVDDNPHERALMRAHLPEVAVVPFPSDLCHPEQFLRRLTQYFFASSGTTAEDALRADDYSASQARLRLRETLAADTVADYLTALELRVRPSVATAEDLDRLAQMAGKTNQFNATTIRRTRADFVALLADSAKRVFTFRTSDRFGEQGLVCYVVVDLSRRRITDFVMSCRAMGRTLEQFAFRHVCGALGFVPEIDVVETAKNRPFREFLSVRDGVSYYREEKVR